MTSKTASTGLATDPQLAEASEISRSVEISRRQFEEGKFSSNDEVFNEMEQMLDEMESLGLTKRRAATSSPIPNAETIAAIEEGDRIVNDPTRKTYDNLDEFWADLEK